MAKNEMSSCDGKNRDDPQLYEQFITKFCKIKG